MAGHKIACQVALVACLLVAAFLIGSLTKGSDSLGEERLGEGEGQYRHVVEKRSVRHEEDRAAERPATDPRTTTPKPDGAVYIRWGRKVCPNEAAIIYIGAIAGGHMSHTGGGGEYVCISDTPVQDKFVAGNSKFSYIYGAEYKAGAPLYNTDNMHGFTNQDGMCVACLSIRNSQVMIPGTNLCPPTWTVEYRGVLMSSKYTDKNNKNYICVDEAPEADRDGFRADGGADMWPVEAACGSLPCPPYEANKELTCVVCSH